MKQHETLLKHSETSQNTQTSAIRCDDIGARWGDIGARHRDISAWHRDIGDWWGDLGDIGDCGAITSQMCNRVTNHGDMGTFPNLSPSLEEECTSGEYIFLFRMCEKNNVYNYYKKSVEIYMICQIIRIRIRKAWEISQPAWKLKLKELDNYQVPTAASAQSSNTPIFCRSLVLHLQLHPKHPHPTSVTSPTVPRTRNTADCWVE